MSKNESTIDKPKKDFFFVKWFKAFKDLVSSTMYWLRAFFFNYIWIGIVFLLISIILEIQFPVDIRSFYLQTLILILNYLGIAIMISAIFSYASGTSEFIDKIRGLLEDIVIKRNFLNNIDPESKKDVLKALIQPSLAETNKYPNIGDYYGYFINKTLEIRKKSVRSNYQINSRAFFDVSKRKIAIEGLYSYRLYPNVDGFNDITVGFEEPEGGDSFCSYVAISTPDGKRKSFKDQEIALKQFDEDGDVSCRATIKVGELAKESNHIDVELKVTEYGSDHWALITFKALQPTDGFKFYLRCDGDIKIQKHSVFVVGAAYYLELDESKQSITIGCNQWINEGSGLSVLVSIHHPIE